MTATRLCHRWTAPVPDGAPLPLASVIGLMRLPASEPRLLRCRPLVVFGSRPEPPLCPHSEASSSCQLDDALELWP